MKLTTCTTCNGTRLKKESLWFKVDEKNIADLSNMDLTELLQWFSGIEDRLNARQNLIAKEINKEIRDRLQFLLVVFCSIEITGERPVILSTSGRSISPINWRA